MENDDRISDLELVVKSKKWSYRSSDNTRKNRFGIDLNMSTVESICKYLENPTKTGIWKLRAEWLSDKGISDFLISIANEKIPLPDDFDYRVSYGAPLPSEDSSLPEGIEIRERLMFALSPILYIFRMAVLDEEKKLEDIEKINESLEHDYRVIFSLLDFDTLREKYMEGYTIFKDEIYRPNSHLFIRKSIPYKVGDDWVFLENAPRDGGPLAIVSLHPESLVVLKRFFSSIGKISECEIRLFFSPEEEVFSQYYSLVMLVYNKLLESDTLREKFKEAITQYEKSEYSHCVSTLGLISEDYLIQIYETYFRDVSPRVPLGEIYNKINEGVADIFKAQPLSKPDATPLYNKLRDAENNLRIRSNNENEQILLEIIRDGITYSKDLQKYNDFLKELDGSSKQKNSIFPKELREKIIELISYRNATSHKSRVHITGYEAQRAMYCLISLVSWWNNELTCIDWKDDKETIMRKSLERNANPKK